MKTYQTAIALLGALALITSGQEAASVSTSIPSGQNQNPSVGQVRAGGGGGGFGSSSATYSTRLANVVARAPAPSSTALYFEPGSEKQAAEMAEDLQVLEYLVSRNLERALGEQTTEYRLGVPILLRGGDGRPVQASYVQGYGVLVKINTPFALTGSAADAPKNKEQTPASEWEKARRALHGDANREQTDDGAAAYDPKIVTAVKKQIFESLKNGKNLRHVKDDEWISVAVVGGSSPIRGGVGTTFGNGFGGGAYGSSFAGVGGAPGAESSGAAPRTSVLAIRVKKSEASGNAEDVARVAQVNAYFEAPGAPSTESRRGQRSVTPAPAGR